MISKLHTKKLDRPEAVQIAAAVVAICLHYVDGSIMGPEALAAAWTALAVPVIQICLRAAGSMLDSEEKAA